MKYHLKPKDFDLTKWRNKNGYTIRSFAKLIGIHYTYLSRLETGKAIASPEMWEKIKKIIK